MKLKRLIITLVFATATITLFSCTVWNARKWEELGNRDFIFGQFKYSHLNAGKALALKTMREFPLDPVLKSLEKKYGIRIDGTEFKSYLSNGDLSKIREEGVIMTNSYTWNNPAQTDNRSEIEIKVNYSDDMRIMNYGYLVVLRVKGSVRAVFFDNVNAYEEVPVRILSHIGSGVTMEGYTPVRHSGGAEKEAITVTPGRRYETEGKIRDLMDDYLKTLTPENKKKFRDDIMRHLDGDAAEKK